MEKFAVRPHIGAVVRDIDWKISNDADPVPFAVFSQCAPLLREEVFQVLAEPKCVACERPPALESHRLAVCNRGFPLRPNPFLMGALDGSEQNVIIEPECV